MRRALPIGLVGVALLLVLGAPFLGVRPGFPDDRVLPTSASAHQVGDQLRDDFANNSATAVPIVIPDSDGLADAEIARYAADLSRVPDVSAVSAPTGTVRRRATWSGPPSAATGQASGSTLLTVDSTAPLFSDRSETQLDRLHAVAAPGGRAVEFTGTAQINRDSVHAITSRLPLVLGLIAVIMLVLLFLLTGSVVLPLKALVLNVLSLTAAFGAMVWIFQDGHLGAFGTTSTGTLVANMPVLLFCIAFGLSMDYEVFLVSRIREFWLGVHGPQAAADNDESVALGHRPHRPGHHRGRADHVDLVRRADRRPRVVHADVRPRPDTGRARRRHPGAPGARAGVHACDGQMELVGTETAGPAASTLTNPVTALPSSEAHGGGYWIGVRADGHSADRLNQPAPGPYPDMGPISVIAGVRGEVARDTATARQRSPKRSCASAGYRELRGDRPRPARAAPRSTVATSSCR